MSMDPEVLLEDALEERLRGMGHRWPGLPPRIQRVVLGLDRHPTCVFAAQWAARLADEVHVVTGLGSQTPRSMGMAPDLVEEAWAEQARRGAAEQMPKVLALLDERSVHRHEVEAWAADGIARIARHVEADAVIVGHEDKGLLDRHVEGSVSESLVHESGLATLVARREPADGPVIAAVGEGQGSAQPAALAAQLALQLDRPLVVAHASHGVDEPESLPDPTGKLDVRRVPWPPKKGVGELAERIDASLIVVGQESRPSWLGSTTIALVRKAPCSVMVAPSPER